MIKFFLQILMEDFFFFMLNTFLLVRPHLDDFLHRYLGIIESEILNGGTIISSSRRERFLVLDFDSYLFIWKLRISFNHNSLKFLLQDAYFVSITFNYFQQRSIKLWSKEKFRKFFRIFKNSLLTFLIDWKPFVRFNNFS